MRKKPFRKITLYPYYCIPFCCLTFLLAFSSPKCFAAVYDDFNGSNIDNTLWLTNDANGILSQSGGLLTADGPPNSKYASLTSKFQFPGDGEFVLDFRNFQITTIYPPKVSNQEPI